MNQQNHVFILEVSWWIINGDKLRCIELNNYGVFSSLTKESVKVTSPFSTDHYYVFIPDHLVVKENWLAVRSNSFIHTDMPWRQWREVTKYFYSSTGLKCFFECSDFMILLLLNYIFLTAAVTSYFMGKIAHWLRKWWFYGINHWFQ